MYFANQCIDQFPKKDLKVVDLMHFLDNKEVVTIILDDGDTCNELFDGRVENLTYTAEGCLHESALNPVHHIEVSTDNKLLIFVEPIMKNLN